MSKRSEVVHGISATRASAILGLNNWKTPLLAWQEIQEKLKPGFNAERGFILPEREDKAVFRWGNAFESAVIELAESAQGDIIGAQEELFMQVPETSNACTGFNTLGVSIRPTAFCYVDGVYAKGSDHKKVNILHEGKTTFHRAFDKSWGEPGTSRVPDHIAIQVQHQMMCAGADECIVSVLVFPKSVDDWEDEGWEISPCGGEGNFYLNNEQGDLTHPSEWARILAQMGYFHQYPIKANRDTQKLLREAYNHFWETYVLTETPPEITDYADIRRLFTAPKGELIAPDDIINMCTEYKAIGKEIGAGGHLKKRQLQLKTDILKFCRTATTVESDENVEKMTLLDNSGNRVGSFSKSGYRA
jgi:hypothetical protein